MLFFLAVCCEACRSKKIVQDEREGVARLSGLRTINLETSVVFPSHLSPNISLFPNPDTVPSLPITVRGASPAAPCTLSIRQHFREVRHDTLTTAATVTNTQSRHPEPPFRPSWWSDFQTALTVLLVAAVFFVTVLILRRSRPN